MPFVAGKTGFIMIEEVEWPMRQWNFRISCQSLDTTNFTTLGFKTVMPGLVSATFGASGPLDPTMTALPVWAPGAYAIIGLGVGGGYWLNADCMITSAAISTGVDKAADLDLQGETSGLFTSVFIPVV